MLNYQNKTKKELIDELIALKSKHSEISDNEHSIVEPEKKFENLTEAFPFAIIIYSPHNNSILYANKEAEKLTGYSQEKLLTMSFWDIIHPENFKHIKDRGLSKLITEVTPSRLELQILKKQGEEKWVNFAFSKIEYSGKPAIMGTAFDITEKKEADIQIRKNEIRFHDLFEHAPLPYLSVNKKGIISNINNAFTLELGYNSKEIENHRIDEFISQNDKKKIIPIFKTILKNGQISNIEIDLITKTNELITYSIVGNILFDMLEKYSRIHFVLYNITEQKKAKEALSFSEEKYKQLVSKLPDLVIIHINGKIVFANDTTSNTIGFTSQDLIGTSVFDNLDDENRKIVFDKIEKRQNINSDFSKYEIVIRTKYNTLRNAEIRVAQVDYEGELAYLTVITDITDRKRMEESLYESQRLIFTLMNNLPGMAYRCLNDSYWTMQFISNGCKDLIEYDPFDLINNNKLSFMQLVHPDDVNKDKKAIQQALQNKKPFQTIYRIITASGKIKWVLEKGVGIYADKELLFIEGIITDITQLKEIEFDLKRSKDNFSIMAENIQDGLTITSGDKVIYMNRRAEEIFGLSSKELLLLLNEKKNLTIAEKNRIVKIKDDLNFEGKGPEFLEYWITTKNESRRFIRNSYSSDNNSSDKTFNYIITSDLTERKIKEDELKNSEEKLRFLINDAPLGIIYADLSGNIEFVNPTMLSLLGSPSIEATQEINLLTFPLLVKFCISKKVLECINTGKRSSSETYYQSKWGKEVYISLKLSPIRNYKKIQTGIMLIVDDITEQKNAEILLKRSEQKNRAILDAIPDIIFRLTNDGVFIDYKAKDSGSLLLPPEEFIGKSMFHVLPQQLAKTTMQHIKMAIQTGDVQNYDYDHTVNNKLFFYEVRMIKSGEEEVMAIIRDITEKRIAEKEIEQLNIELIDKNKEQEQIIYVASHDLRSPLVNIQGFSTELFKTFETAKSIIYSEENTNEIRERLSNMFETEIPDSFNYIFSSTHKMDLLIAGLLKISRLGRVILNKQIIDMNQLMKLVLNIFEFQMKEKNISITFKELPNCYGDEMMINQIFSNLIDNAIKYLSPIRSGKICISGHIDNNDSIYCIEDNGIGIQSNYFNKIFELFHRLDNNQKGEGLGLAIAKKIIEKHNGRIWLESEQNIGTKFFISLPNNFKE